MITVETALELLQSQLPGASKVDVNLAESCGMILAEDIHSPISMPPFNQSAMDGYALRLWDKDHYEIKGEVKAGDGHNPHLNPGEAIRIFTGAMVPDLANTIVMQEHVEVDNSNLTLSRDISTNQNIRYEGEQIRLGEIALSASTEINAAAIGYLSGLGITKLKVWRRPEVAILSTGNELTQPGDELERGKIYESNAKMLASALTREGNYGVRLFQVDDSYDETLKRLEEALVSSDLLLISGGISVGDYDYVGKALKELGVREVFYKVKQKPGKPLFFGRKEDKCIFGLPGNPAAALTCFYVYVIPVLNHLTGKGFTALPRTKAVSQSTMISKGDRAQFLKAKLIDNRVEILEGQSSSMLRTYALANALVYLQAPPRSIEPGDHLDVINLPN